MRLTLRTLMALRNRTLRPEDESLLSEKVRGSSYAQSILTSITNVLRSRQLGAPDPRATGPTDDANMIAEYLDSTLTPEQAAEVDRTCLESPEHLAEVAASHEVLTLVLGKPADVPPGLRDRVYKIGSDVTQTVDATGAPPESAEVAAAATVVPVSVTDSGAYQAVSRMEASTSTDSVRGPRSDAAVAAALAGSRPLSAQEADELFGDRVRFSRALPWLVTLGLVAALLFVMVKAFGPLLEREEVTTAASTPTATDPANPDPMASGAATRGEGDAEPAEKEEASQPDSPDRDIASEGGPITTPEALEVPAGSNKAEQSDNDAAGMPPTDAEDTAAAEGAPPESSSSEVSREPQPETGSSDPVMADGSPSDAEVAAPAPTPRDPATSEPASLEFLSEEGVLLLQSPEGQGWLSLTEIGPFPLGAKLVTPPLFRNTIRIGDTVELTMAGATIASIERGSTMTLHLEMGRVLVTSLQEGATLDLRIGDQTTSLTLADQGATIAIENEPFRAPGTNPLLAENHFDVTRLTAIVGPANWEVAESYDLETQQQWRWISGGEPEMVSEAAEVDWAGSPDLGPIERGAKDQLARFVREVPNAREALLNATKFRRAEVVALAAGTLALLGDTKVFFGSEGMLGDDDQKSFWRDHVAALQQRIDLSVPAAKSVQASLQTMDAASAEVLFRMLWGYSPEQLQTGSDAFLVENLDSPQMEIRVIALETLRNITGTSLYYKPEQKTASRRKNDLKKWEAQLRRGDIRWRALPIAGVDPPPAED